MCKLWFTKRVADWCDTNKRPSCLDKEVTSQCRCCKKMEDSTHVTWYTHPIQRKLLKKTTRDIPTWTIYSGIEVELVVVAERWPRESNNEELSPS